MKTTALTTLILLASSGSVFANQLNEASSVSNEPATHTVVQKSPDDKQFTNATDVSVKGSVVQSKSNQERDRERKGLPRYWHG